MDLQYIYTRSLSLTFDSVSHVGIRLLEVREVLVYLRPHPLPVFVDTKERTKDR